jgi:hypothetical protein
MDEEAEDYGADYGASDEDMWGDSSSESSDSGWDAGAPTGEDDYSTPWYDPSSSGGDGSTPWAQYADADVPGLPGLPTGSTGQTPGPLAPYAPGMPGQDIPPVPGSSPSSPSWFSRAKDWFTGNTKVGDDWTAGTPWASPNQSHDDPQTRDRVARDSADKESAARQGVTWPKMPAFNF